MKIGFCLHEMTFLKYFLPISQYFKNKNTDIFFYSFGGEGKDSYPFASQNLDNHKFLDQYYNKKYFSPEEVVAFCNNDDVDFLFLVEGLPFHGVNLKPKNTKFISLPYLSDYTRLFPKYSELVDYFIFPSAWMAQYAAGLDKAKLKILGCPKYDCVKALDVNELRSKYFLDDRPLILIFAPNKRDVKRCLLAIWQIKRFALKNNFSVLIKTRVKHMSVGLKALGIRILLDDSYWPPTSIELIKLSSLVVMFDSMAIKEAVVIGKPVLNLNVKAYRTHDFRPILAAFYDMTKKFKYIWDVKKMYFSKGELNEIVESALCAEESSFSELQDKFFCNTQKVSGKIYHFLTSI